MTPEVLTKAIDYATAVLEDLENKFDHRRPMFSTAYQINFAAGRFEWHTNNYLETHSRFIHPATTADQRELYKHAYLTSQYKALAYATVVKELVKNAGILDL
jgi:hypothetical protein